MGYDHLEIERGGHVATLWLNRPEKLNAMPQDKWGRPDTVFSIRETLMGIVADVGTLQRLPAIVGAGHTAELAFTGADIDA